jgi:flagellar motor switch protein FliG
MIVLGAKKAAELISRSGIPPADIERLAAEIAAVGEIGPDIRRAVVGEFARSLESRDGVLSGLAMAREMIASLLAPERAADVLSRLESRGSETPFLSLSALGSKQLTALLSDEQPQVTAVALRYLPRAKAAEVLAGLPEDARIDVVMRFVKSDDPLPDAVRTLGDALWRKAGAAGGWDEADAAKGAVTGARALVEVLNNADLVVENSVLEALAERDPELGEQVRQSMFVFEDLPRLDPRALQLVLRSAEMSDLTVALKGAAEEIRRVVFENLSENAAASLKEDLEAMGPVRRRDVLAAQQRIVTAVRALGEEGKISVRVAEQQAEEMIA